MIGAIIGDIAGSTYEFCNTRDYDFPLFASGSSYTDDTVCTMAVADALVHGDGDYCRAMVEWTLRYPHPMGSYGLRFRQWTLSAEHHPYGSYGNGAAMRVSPVGWAFESEAEVLRDAQASAAITHNHPEGIRGAQATALAILAARHHTATPAQIAERFYGADYRQRLPQPGVWDETCQGCVPLALEIADKATGFEDAVRRAISYGGDSDTLGAIVGGIAQARWEIPAELRSKALQLLPQEMQQLLNEFEQRFDIE